MAISLNTTGDALQFLVDNAGKDDRDVPDIVLGGELSKIHIHVEGADYHGSFPGEFARGLWEFQEAIYNAVAFALYGVEDLRKLTGAQKEDFNIVFEISEGSLDIGALLEKFFDTFEKGFSSMDSKHKSVTIVAVAIILATFWGGAKIAESFADVKKTQIEAQTKVNLEHERTNQFKLFADVTKNNLIAAAFEKATETGGRAIVKRAQGATEIKLGALHLDQDDIEEVHHRAAREKAEADLIDGKFSVVRVETRDSATTKLILSSPKTGEFQAILQDEDLDADQLANFWAAVAKRKEIDIQVNATRIRDAIKTAQVIAVGR